MFDGIAEHEVAERDCFLGGFVCVCFFVLFFYMKLLIFLFIFFLFISV